MFYIVQHLKYYVVITIPGTYHSRTFPEISRGTYTYQPHTHVVDSRCNVVRKTCLKMRTGYVLRNPRGVRTRYEKQCT